MSENFAQLLEESLSHSVMKPGAVIEAEVVDISADFVIVNAGLKSEAEIPVNQFKDAAGNLDIAVGDKVEVAIEVVEDGFGNTRLSRERARRARSWEMLEKAFEEQSIVTGNMTGTVKGGFTVAIEGVRAFLPGSLVDIRPISDMAYLENKELEFKVIKLDQVRNNVVVSRRAVVEKEMEAERKQLLENIEEGQVIRGVVKNLTDYGAFVNLGGLDGLLHITDISWKRVKHPSEVVNVGDEVDVRVLKFDRGRNRVSLGMKQLGDDPWTDISRRYPESSRLFGKVTNVTDYGAFVELEEGIEGLVHVSEMDWTNRNVHPNKVCHVGDEIEVMVLDVDSDRRRVSLGIKQCKANPWEEFAAIHKKGDQITGQIKSITDFGVFIGLDGGIDGLIHLSDLSWDETGEDVARNHNKGDEVTAVVLAVDADRERISLGLKQSQSDPFLTFVSENPKGSLVKGTVESVDAKAATIKLADGVEGMLRATELSRNYVEDARMSLNEGDAVEVKVTSIERKDRRITLSIKAMELDRESQAVKGYGTQAIGTTSLGDKLKEQLDKSPEAS
ncbi:MAG TPA: 30S ribosomal protein S1 [Gammaproteobacteria bacterium]|jgi:small subunit ribosomal protein S1|nr:30S ribosomal protein S1 [Acidiferrobacteraceae bacterium]HAG45312.1 30S ribosomal protein S1 [Gammaproteobacteria bacterium]HAU11270.1 30S ribosomal protein S1 [Gammaproteobacteria bacterium]HIM69648.1 30S ribosomal protein S1 [Gammaproteobacteria bacterium]|tara:strand:+ start:542 stop:2221 length:1680 start_codon:yes stop_codon:yes gene_type:complete